MSFQPGAQEVAVQGPALFSPVPMDTGAPQILGPESPGLIPNQGFKMEVNWHSLLWLRFTYISLRHDIVVYDIIVYDIIVYDIVVQ